MMLLPRLYARLCARQAGRTLLANRITQNYSQFMRCPEADVPADFLHQNAHELSGFNFVEQIFPPALWARNVRFDLHGYVAQWTREQAFYSSSRTLLLGMRWAGFGLIVDALLASAPADVRFQFITRHPALHKLMAAHEGRRASSFFAPHRLVTVLLMDERLPDAPLFSTQAGDQKAWLTDVSTRFLSRRPNAAADLFAARGGVWAGESGVCAGGLPSGRRRHAERAAQNPHALECMG
ncbi:hypothetical protein [Enterobacter hormaechei]|uniref:hypothetical protein n=1 Tax=Enterobacter hormaechei TaxID=158836 RepID=UPI002949AC09|nr:hypothetical protein [Enterobacter hormaechei]MDV5732777.1 hypothetical protein [Enterobacter hormaechei]MDV5804708.1 hypothetical protein [Enterobacter hormaechei]MDV5837988.1 hypothetical protein [Enterobacter hormaechei]